MIELLYCYLIHDRRPKIDGLLHVPCSCLASRFPCRESASLCPGLTIEIEPSFPRKYLKELHQPTHVFSFLPNTCRQAPASHKCVRSVRSTPIEPCVPLPPLYHLSWRITQWNDCGASAQVSIWRIKTSPGSCECTTFHSSQYSTMKNFFAAAVVFCLASVVVASPVLLPVSFLDYLPAYLITNNVLISESKVLARILMAMPSDSIR